MGSRMTFPSVAGLMPSFDSLMARSMSFVVCGVKGLDDEHARLRSGDDGELLELHLRAVGLDVDVLDERGRGLARAHAGEFMGHVIGGLFHGGLGFEEDFVRSHKRFFGIKAADERGHFFNRR